MNMIANVETMQKLADELAHTADVDSLRVARRYVESLGVLNQVTGRTDNAVAVDPEAADPSERQIAKHLEFFELTDVVHFFPKPRVF